MGKNKICLILLIVICFFGLIFVQWIIDRIVTSLFDNTSTNDSAIIMAAELLGLVIIAMIFILIFSINCQKSFLGINLSIYKQALEMALEIILILWCIYFLLASMMKNDGNFLTVILNRNKLFPNEVNCENATGLAIECTILINLVAWINKFYDYLVS